MCKYVKPNVLYSEVLKNSELVVKNVQSIHTRCFSSCFNSKPSQNNTGGSRNAAVYGSNSRSIFLPSRTREVSKEQCVSYMCRNVTNTVKSRC